MTMAVSGSLRHIVWLQRFDGFTETKHLCQNSSCAFGFTHWSFLFLTFSVLVFYLDGNFFLAVHPQQSLLLGGWSLVGKTVPVLRAPGQVASFTNECTFGGLILLVARWTQVSQSIFRWHYSVFEHDSYRRPSLGFTFHNGITGVNLIDLNLSTENTVTKVWGVGIYLQGFVLTEQLQCIKAKRKAATE